MSNRNFKINALQKHYKPTVYITPLEYKLKENC